MSTLLKKFLEEILFIDQRSKDTVHRYLRQIEQQVDIIPSIIFHLILAFYCKSDEYFGKAGENVILSNKDRTVKKIGNGLWDNTTYGNNWINSIRDIIVKWEFQIDHNELENTGLTIHRKRVSKDGKHWNVYWIDTPLTNAADEVTK